MKTFVLNGWAAGPDAWSLCRFQRDRVFSYLEELDGLARAAVEASGEPVRLVGWSMGGAMALDLAADFPDKIASLVLVAATARMMEDRAALWRGMSERRLAAFEYAMELGGGAGLFGLPEGRPNPYLAESPENLARGIAFLRETDLRAKLERVFAGRGCGFPVHIFQSERDGIVRSENAAYLARIFPDAAVTMVPGSEHALPVAIPDLIDRALRVDSHGGKGV